MNNSSFWDRLAIESYYTLLAKNNKRAFLFVGLGLAYARVGETSLAINSLQKALELDPKSPAAYHLSQILVQENAIENGLNYLKHYVNSNSNHLIDSAKETLLKLEQYHATQKNILQSDL